jgi:hypothetical protein
MISHHGRWGTSCKIRGGQCDTGEGFSWNFFWSSLLIIIPTLLHTGPVQANRNCRQENDHFQRHNIVFSHRGKWDCETVLRTLWFLLREEGRLIQPHRSYGSERPFSLQTAHTIQPIPRPTQFNPADGSRIFFGILLQDYTMPNPRRLQSEESLL